MYTRANRFPTNQISNPTIGPGCYTADEQTLHSGKTLGKDGFAPFSSLSKKISYFDENVGKNPLGIYEIGIAPVGVHNHDAASTFGKSTAKRFTELDNHVPSPNSYSLPSTLKISTARKHKERMMQLFDIETEANSRVNSRESVVNHALRSKLTTGEHGLIWKRKFIPPSIPMGNTTFGYKETSTGDLIPRKPPTKKTVETVIPNSFVEKAKQENKGFKFSKFSKRLEFEIVDAPGPAQYDVKTPRTSHTGNAAALMTFAPCVRITDTVIKDEERKAIPGPGSYNVKAPLEISLAKKNHRISFGLSTADRLSMIKKTDSPAPCSYYPELHDSKIEHKQQAFNSTTVRFANANKTKVDPSPGSYNVEDYNSVSSTVKRLAKVGNGIKFRAFGTVNDRFKNTEEHFSNTPGPADYTNEITASKKLGFSTYNYFHHYNSKKYQSSPELLERDHTVLTHIPKGPITKIRLLAKKGIPLNMVYGGSSLAEDFQNTHIPVFGQQSDRFDKGQPSTAPEFYEVSTAFERVKSRGKEIKGGIRSNVQRDVFSVKESIPGPGEYEPAPVRSKIHSRKAEDFLSSEPRFVNKFKPETPAPNAYNARAEFLKKSFNVTIGENYDYIKHQRLQIST